MKKLKVALIFGGKSGEHEVSIVSALSVYQALDPERYDVQLIGIDPNGRWLKPDQTLILAQKKNPRNIQLQKVQQELALLPFAAQKPWVELPSSGQALQARHQFDVVLPILHGTYGEDGTIQGLFELMNIPYIGSGVLGSSVGMDKDVCKRLLRDSDIPVVPFQTIRKSEFHRQSSELLNSLEKTFGYPYFVKPANMGSSVGVHKVKSRNQAEQALNDAFQYDQKVLIEKAVRARELECAVLGNNSPQASIVGEIIPTHEFYTYEAKYLDEKGADLKIPAEGLSKEEVKAIQNLSVRAFLAIECSGMARVDFFYDLDSKQIYVNELNTIPGFTPISMYPKLWEASGISYSQLLDQLIQLALEKHQAKNSLKTAYL